MLYICTNQYDFPWHVGEALPRVEDNVTEVQADGDELEWIVKNLPHVVVDASRLVQAFKYGKAQHIYNQMKTRLPGRPVKPGPDTFSL